MLGCYMNSVDKKPDESVLVEMKSGCQERRRTAMRDNYVVLLSESEEDVMKQGSDEDVW